MAKDRDHPPGKNKRVATDDAEPRGHAPKGRGGTAMGRTVGLPYGGGRPRKRRARKPTPRGE